MPARVLLPIMVTQEDSQYWDCRPQNGLYEIKPMQQMSIATTLTLGFVGGGQ